MSFPARHRAALLEQSAGQLTVTRHPDGCLLLYPRPVWETKREQIANFPVSARHVKRLLLGNAQDVELDGSGRILIAPELRSAASLTREVLLMGMGEGFELWDAPTYQQQEAAALEAGVPEDLLIDFSF